MKNATEVATELSSRPERSVVERSAVLLVLIHPLKENRRVTHPVRLPLDPHCYGLSPG
jgi:hypothetical protein